MTAIQILPAICNGEAEGERGERGERGKRGHRGHGGRDGRMGPTGPTGLTGPTGPVGSTGPGVFPMLIAAGIIDSTQSTARSTGIALIQHPATGQFTITLSDPPPSNNDLIVLVTLAGTTGGQDSYVFPALGMITINTFNAAGVPVDALFSIAVYSLA